MSPEEIVNVIDTYEGLIARAKRAGKRSPADQKSWAKEATQALLQPQSPPRNIHA
jgi:hypothetical protein